MPANPSTAIGLPWLGTGALFAALGVAAGAFGAHGLRAMLAEPLLLLTAGYYPSAVLYLVYGAFVLWGFFVWLKVQRTETAATDAPADAEASAEPQPVRH
mgnify:CR=1 FL=1